jgi:hypothetical protein
MADVVSFPDSAVQSFNRAVAMDKLGDHDQSSRLLIKAVAQRWPELIDWDAAEELITPAERRSFLLGF